MLVTLALVAATLQAAQKPAAAPDLTDPEVAHVAVTANAIDIDLAKFAQTRTRTPATVAMRRHQILTSGHSLNRSSRCTAHCQMRAERVYVMHTEMAVAHRAVQGSDEQRWATNTGRKACSCDS